MKWNQAEGFFCSAKTCKGLNVYYNPIIKKNGGETNWAWLPLIRTFSYAILFQKKLIKS